MYYREIARVIAFYLYVLAAALVVPFALAIYYQFGADPSTHPQPHSTGAFASTILTDLLLATGFRFFGTRAKGRLFKKEALALVVSIWFVTALVGGLPFYFSSTFDHFYDAYFEAMSGLTTTGATVMSPKAYDPSSGSEIAVTKTFSDLYDVAYTFYGTITPVRSSTDGEVLYEGIEAVGKALLFWRSFMQWLGGMGIVVLFVAVLPALGVGGKAMYQAEVPGPAKDSLTPRIKETASMLWKLYLGFSVAEFALLLVTNAEMTVYDAVCMTLSNVSTGGFSVKNTSIAAYHNVKTEWVVIAFMLVGSINFNLYFQMLKGKFFRIFEPEFVVYVCILALSCGLAVYNLVGTPHSTLAGTTEGNYSMADAVRYGIFQSVTAQTGTGFSTADYDKWPFINQVQMLIVMFVGSMAGSTGGGIKIIRHYMIFRIVQRKVESLFRPNAVQTLRVGKKEVTDKSAITVMSFFMIVIFMTAIGTLLLALDGVDPETALATNTCMINNIGIAFRMGGPTESFVFLSPTAKVFSTFWMVAGRLEFFAVLVLFVPGFWKAR